LVTNYLFHSTLLGDVDTVQELTDILILNTCRLVDFGGGLRNLLDVVTGQDDLFLNVFRAGNSDTFQHGHASDDTFSQKVSDLNLLAVIRDVDTDGKVSVNESHLVLVTLENTSEHISDLGDNGVDASVVLSVTPPDINADLLADLADVALKVAEILGESTTRTLDDNLSGLDGNFRNSVRNRKDLRGKDSFHF
jgi:hypothetical protein